MPGELLYTRKDGREYHLGELVKLGHDADFAEWNDLWLEKHGMLVPLYNLIDWMNCKVASIVFSQGCKKLIVFVQNPTIQK